MNTGIAAGIQGAKGVAKGDIEVDTLLLGICQTLGLYDESRSHYEMIRTVRSLTSNKYVKYVEVLSKLRKFDEAGWLLGGCRCLS